MYVKLSRQWLCVLLIRYRPRFKTPKVDCTEDVSVQIKTKARKYNLAYAVSFDSSGKLVCSLVLFLLFLSLTGVPKEPNPDAVDFINSKNPLVATLTEVKYAHRACMNDMRYGKYLLDLSSQAHG